MSEPTIPLSEFDGEMKTTRRLIERVPSDRNTWKPHQKSFSVGHLAQLLSGMPGWITSSLRGDSLEIRENGPGYSDETTETHLALFDKNVADARKALQEVTGAALDKDWSLLMGGKPVMTLPKKVVVRQHLNHLIHHRGQMSVYLRLLDIPVPSIYGPTADEKWGG
jgi:uncharacterized damage-inducible protein DinB